MPGFTADVGLKITLAVALTTLATCYITAQALKHDSPVWFPPISFTGNRPPETFFYRTGLSFVAYLLLPLCFLLFYFHKTVTPRAPVLRYLLLISGCVSALGCGLQALIPINEPYLREVVDAWDSGDSVVTPTQAMYHFFFAGCFFFGGFVHMFLSIFQSRNLIRDDPTHSSTHSILWKVRLAFLLLCVVAELVVLFGISPNSSLQTYFGLQGWSQYICILTILIHYVTHVAELKHVKIKIFVDSEEQNMNNDANASSRGTDLGLSAALVPPASPVVVSSSAPPAK